MKRSVRNDQYTVVVADDFPAVRKLMTSALERTGSFKVVAEVEDGDAALAAVVAFRPDAIALDLAMPRRSGLAVLPELRATAPEALIAVLSSLGPDVLGEAVWTSGADLFMTKETRIETFVAELLTELTVRRATAQTA